MKVRVRLSRAWVEWVLKWPRGGQVFLSPEPYVHLFAVGDMIHVFEGTGVGKEGQRNIGWFGKVVGREGDAFLVRNRLLAAKGRPNLVDGQFMKLQSDFGFECGSGERVHFRNLSAKMSGEFR